MKKAAFFLIVFFLVHITGRAGDVTWTGAVDNNWHNPGNWSSNNVPGPQDKAIIPSGTPNCTIQGNAWAGEIQNKGFIQLYNYNYNSTISTNKFDNQGSVTQGTSNGYATITGINQGTVEVNNSGQIHGSFLTIQNGSTVNNSGEITAHQVVIQADVLTNQSNANINCINMNVNSNEIKNYGTLQANPSWSNEGMTMTGNTLHNEGTITTNIVHDCKNPAIEMTFKKSVENYPNGKITYKSSVNKDNQININSPKLYNYGQIKGYKTITDQIRTDSIPAGIITLVSEDLLLDYTSVVKAEKIFLIFHDFFTYDIPISHSMEAVSGIEFRGDKGSLWYIQSTCVENLLYSQSGGIRILSDTIRTDSSTLQYLCDPDPQAGPSDTTFISGHIASTSVIDSSNSTGTFRVYLQNQGTCHKAFQYSITSPHGWITPVTGTTQVLKPFQYDSLEIHYSIPSKPTVKTESILQTFSVPGLYTDTSYSFITVTDSVNVGIEENLRNNQGFTLFLSPNPFSDYCRVVSNRDAKMYVYDLFGRLVFETFVMKDKATDWYPAPETGSGCYLVLARSGNQYSCKKAFFMK